MLLLIISKNIVCLILVLVLVLKQVCVEIIICLKSRIVSMLVVHIVILQRIIHSLHSIVIVRHVLRKQIHPRVLIALIVALDHRGLNCLFILIFSYINSTLK